MLCSLPLKKKREKVIIVIQFLLKMLLAMWHTLLRKMGRKVCACVCVCVCVCGRVMFSEKHTPKGGGRTYFDGDKRVSEIRESLWVSLFFSKIVF